MKILRLFLIFTSVLFSFNAANAFDWKHILEKLLQF